MLREFYTENRIKTSFKEKRSEFIGHLFPVESVESVGTELKKLKKEWLQARHICWGYRIYKGSNLIENSSDAGEPNGSAGIPILHAIKKTDLVNVVIFVIRIFGGVKLGKRGLIDAYGKSAEMTIGKAKLKKRIKRIKVNLSADQMWYGEMSASIARNQIKMIEDKSAENINWILEMKEELYPNFKDEVIQATRSTAKISKNNKE